MPRFFIEDIPQGRYLLEGEAGLHGAKVLRMRPGEEVTLCSGKGQDYLCQVQENTGSALALQVLEERPSQGEPQTKVIVCQCLPKGDKLETVVQKSVELGANSIWPVESRYCVAKWDQKAQAKKRARLEKIAQEAAMQSGRGIVPKVLPPARLEEVLRSAAKAEGAKTVFLYEKATKGLKEGLTALPETVFLVVGPEGGFAPEEAALARELGAELLSLGPRILRTETAPLAALAAIMYEKGEMAL